MYLEIAQIYIEIQDYEKALSILTERSINNENEVIYYALLSKLYIQTKEFSKALNYAKKWGDSIRDLDYNKKINPKNIDIIFKEEIYTK